MTPALLAELRAAIADKRQVVLATWLDGTRQALLAAGGELEAEVRSVLQRDASEVVETAAGPVFLEAFNPPTRLVIVGAVHVGQALARLAGIAGFAVTVVDPRSAFVVPGVERVIAWPDEGLAGLGLDARTAVVTLTHDPKLDDPALTVALRSPAFYVGALGSRKTHAARLERLRAHGFTDAELARIHAPVGLDLGARSPAEIAVSILAEITQRLRQPPP